MKTDEIHFKMCSRKKYYDTKTEAKKVMKKMKRSGIRGIKPYRCLFCGLWHNGHPKKNPVGIDGLAIDDI